MKKKGKAQRQQRALEYLKRDLEIQEKFHLSSLGRVKNEIAILEKRLGLAQ